MPSLVFWLSAFLVTLAITFAPLLSRSSVVHAKDGFSDCTWNLKHSFGVPEDSVGAKCLEIMGVLSDGGSARGMNGVQISDLQDCVGGNLKKGADIDGVVNSCFDSLGFSTAQPPASFSAEPPPPTGMTENQALAISRSRSTRYSDSASALTVSANAAG